MKVAKYITITATAFMFACGPKRNEIEIGEFSLLFPEDFKLVNEKGIDSYVGKISNGEMEFRFDYGYYSNSLEKSPSEYLSQDVWKWNALTLTNLAPSGSDLGKLAKSTELVKIETSDSVFYTLHYLFEGKKISYEVEVPEEIRNCRINIDTVGNVVYKIVQGEHHVGLFAKNLRNFNKSMNSFQTLSIVSDTTLKVKEAKYALQILRSCKLKQ